MIRCPTTIASLLLAASAGAAPFHVLSYEAGGGLPGVAGMGYSVDFGGFFTADGAGDNVVGGGAANFTVANEQAFDSHFALDGFGPTARCRIAPSPVPPDLYETFTQLFYGDYGPGLTGLNNYNELEGTTQNGHGPFNAVGAVYISAPGSHIGDPLLGGVNENSARAGMAVSPPPVLSHFAPNVTGGRSPHHGVFVGRFTIKEGATLSGGIVLNTSVAPGVFDTHELVLGGSSVLFQTSGGPQYLSLRAYRVTETIFNLSNPSAASGNGETPYGLAKVIDVWVQVPGPGAPAVAMLPMLLVTTQRRR